MIRFYSAFLNRPSPESGIALGPIIFIIAVLAIIAAAIAAGAGGFSGSSSTENAKAMAEVIIQSCGAHQDALQIVLANGCDVTALDFTPTGGYWPTGTTGWQTGDLTGGNGTNQAGSGQCALYDPRGGALTYKPLPAAALATVHSGGYTSQFGSFATVMDAYAGYPIFEGYRCLTGFGNCSQNDGDMIVGYNAPLVLDYSYLSYDVCKQINTLLGITIDPKTYANQVAPANLSITSGYYFQSAPSNNIRATSIFYNSGKHYLQGCAYDPYSNTNSVYHYSCALMVR